MAKAPAATTAIRANNRIQRVSTQVSTVSEAIFATHRPTDQMVSTCICSYTSLQAIAVSTDEASLNGNSATHCTDTKKTVPKARQEGQHRSWDLHFLRRQCEPVVDDARPWHRTELRRQMPHHLLHASWKKRSCRSVLPMQRLPCALLARPPGCFRPRHGVRDKERVPEGNARKQ